MTIWQKPLIYTVIHILSGSISYYYPDLILFIVGYHLSQYFLNVRFFAFELKTERGNSVEHTVVKLLEVLIGYLLAYLITN
jgi:hypothetical protein